ncbi:MAG: dienelactone hydrolase family protein [Candidatus Thermoplasmatota archaeon]|nr:dienelactone hydrolase family protein [Candidatus Thermoplasmatota archaeon]MCL5984686.1 dienelactone hydrolase family protein [Candidatus Thermoplasmatota archaeon]
MSDEDLLLPGTESREFGAGVVGVCDVCHKRQAVIILNKERFKLCVLDFLNKSWIKSEEKPAAFTFPFSSSTDFIRTSAVPGGVLHAIRLKPSKLVKHPLVMIVPDPVGVSTQNIEAAVRFARAGYDVVMPDTGRIPGLSFVVDYVLDRGTRFLKGAVLLPASRRLRLLRVMDACRRHVLQDDMIDPSRQAIYGASYGATFALAYAAESEGIKAVALAYPYAVTPLGRLASISAPVHAVYGKKDRRAGFSSDLLARGFSSWGIEYSTTVIPGVDHNFLGRDETSYRVRGAEKGWQAILDFVHSRFEPPQAATPNLPPGVLVTAPKTVGVTSH